MSYTLVTSGSRGIGKELALEFAQNDNNIVIVSELQDELASAAVEIMGTAPGVRVLPLEKDLQKERASLELFREIQLQNIRVRTLINIFEVTTVTPMDKCENYPHEMSVINLSPLTSLTECFLPGMIAAGGGEVINIFLSVKSKFNQRGVVASGCRSYVRAFSSSLHEALSSKLVTISYFGVSGHILKEYCIFDDAIVPAKINGDSLTIAKTIYSLTRKADRSVSSGMKGKILTLVQKLISKGRKESKEWGFPVEDDSLF